MRTILLIAIFSLGAFVASGQKKGSPPKPSSPPPPPTPTVGSAGSAGSAGFRLLKIPVSEGYFLGMTRQEFDSVRSISPAKIHGANTAYPAQASPFFTGSRLYALGFTIDSLFNDPPADIFEFYKTRLGDPDRTESADTTMQLPDKNDATIMADYPVKTVQLTWQLQLHDVVITYILADLRNGSNRTILSVRYRGNAVYWRMLKDQEMRGGE